MQEQQRSPVTRAQLEIWLIDPTTKKYLHCLQRCIESNIAYMGEGRFVLDDPFRTHAIASGLIGERQGFQMALDYKTVLSQFELLEPGEAHEDG